MNLKQRCLSEYQADLDNQVIVAQREIRETKAFIKRSFNATFDAEVEMADIDYDGTEYTVVADGLLFRYVPGEYTLPKWSLAKTIDGKT